MQRIIIILHLVLHIGYIKNNHFILMHKLWLNVNKTLNYYQGIF